MARRTKNLGLIFAIGAAAFYFWQQKKKAAAQAALPSTVSSSVTGTATSVASH